MKAILNRLKEPSTWAGIGALAVVFGVPAVQVDAAVQIAVAVSGALAVMLPEAGGGAS